MIRRDKPNAARTRASRLAAPALLAILAACASDGLEPVYDDGLYDDGLFSAAGPPVRERPTS